MTKPPPSLALDMSTQGITLHQLAFDGHWHQLAHVALDDPALRERLVNMRGIAAKLDGRRFKARVWLPGDQIIQKNLRIVGEDEKARLGMARNEIAALLGGKPGDYAVQVGAVQENGDHAVAAVRIRTLIEAKTFAKSHGFRARGYSTQMAVNGFAEPPNFEIPADKIKSAALGLVAASAAVIVFAGGYMFYTLDPFDLWETPPEAADFAPFQQPNPGIERAGAPAAPAAARGAPSFPDFEAISSDSLPLPLPYLPPRQLTAEALEEIIQPDPPIQGEPPESMANPVTVAVNWPATIQPLPAPAGPDDQPSLGLISLLNRIAELPQPEIDQPPAPPGGATATFSAPPRPITVANTAFFLEPLPAMATRLSPDALAEFVNRSGLSAAQLSRMASPILLIESRLVEVIPGLPPILPSLRSGRPIPEQVEPPATPQVAEPPQAEAPSTAPAPLFNLVQGRPEITPTRRPQPPQAENTPPAAIQSTEPAADAQALANAVDAAIEAALPDLPYALISGRPPVLPQLRSGATISPQVFASAAPDISPETAEANALRPLRRPAAALNRRETVDPMISGAAPTVAVRPSRRNEAFLANAARIDDSRASRPRASAPVVPADPQTVSLPTSASVARSATIENALNLRKTNLLGIIGAAGSRTALILLPGGRIVRVQQGQSFSGWTVVAIGPDTVRIKKRRREEILRMPAE